MDTWIVLHGIELAHSGCDWTDAPFRPNPNIASVNVNVTSQLIMSHAIIPLDENWHYMRKDDVQQATRQCTKS